MMMTYDFHSASSLRRPQGIRHNVGAPEEGALRRTSVNETEKERDAMNAAWQSSSSESAPSFELRSVPAMGMRFE